MKKLIKNGKSGFTLVELVIVIAILAIVAAIAIPTVSGLINTANRNVDLSNAQTIELALKSADAQKVSNTADTNIASLTKDATVDQVLKASGVSITANASGTYETRAGGQFYYTSDKTVGASTGTLASGQTELKSTVKMSDIFSDWK